MLKKIHKPDQHSRGEPDGPHLAPGDHSEDMELLERPAMKRLFSAPSHTEFTGLNTHWG